MGQLLEYLFEKKDDFKGNPKELDKLIKKIESCSHAPTTDKHAQRMLPFAENPELVSFVNQKLKDHIINCNEFNDDENGWKNYDVIASWYLFTLLIYSKKAEDTVVFALDRMKASKNSTLSLLRRILHLCNNPAYEKQFAEIEDYFRNLNRETTIYKWLNKLGVTPPPTYNWELIFGLRAEAGTDYKLSDNLYLLVKGFEPDGKGKSFEIEISNREKDISERWNDFSDESLFRFKTQKIQLKNVPDILRLKDFISELEEIFGLKFERKFAFNYFTKGFKKKENIQKWLVE